MHHALALELSCEGDDHFIHLLTEKLEEFSLRGGKRCEPVDNYKAHIRSCG